MIEHISIDEWRGLDAAHPAPTFFARPGWSLALAEAHPRMRPCPLRIRIGNGRTLLVPSMRMPGGALRWREYCAFPMGGYTSFMREDGTLASLDECERAIAILARESDLATLIPWPLAPSPATWRATSHETAVVDLGDGLEAALSRVEGIFRRMAGQAVRRGVVCAPSSDPNAVDVYYEMLEASARRWGLSRPHVPKSLLSALVRHGKDDVEIWFAQAEGRAIAGGVVFFGAQELFFWSAAMLAEFGRLRPSNALNFALLRAAADRGVRWYNLGASEGLPGVARFKSDLGAQTVEYHELAVESARFKIYSNVRRAIRTRATA